MRGCQVSIDGEVFDTIKEAADYLEMNAYDLAGTLMDNEEKNIKGFVVKRLKKRISRLSGKIYCYKNGKIFKNALVLGKILHVNPTYITQKLRTENKYVDIYGNTYRRVQNEENFKNAEVIDEIKVAEINKAKQDAINKSIQEKFEAKQQKELEQSQPKVENKKEVNVRDSLKEALILLVDKKDYEHAKTLLDIMEELK